MNDYIVWVEEKLNDSKLLLLKEKPNDLGLVTVSWAQTCVVGTIICTHQEIAVGVDSLNSNQAQIKITGKVVELCIAAVTSRAHFPAGEF